MTLDQVTGTPVTTADTREEQRSSASCPPATKLAARGGHALPRAFEPAEQVTGKKLIDYL